MGSSEITVVFARNNRQDRDRAGVHRGLHLDVDVVLQLWSHLWSSSSSTTIVATAASPAQHHPYFNADLISPSTSTRQQQHQHSHPKLSSSPAQLRSWPQAATQRTRSRTETHELRQWQTGKLHCCRQHHYLYLNHICSTQTMLSATAARRRLSVRPQADPTLETAPWRVEFRLKLGPLQEDESTNTDWTTVI